MIRTIYNHKYVFGFLSVLTFLFFTFLAFGHSLYQGFAPIDDIFLIVDNVAIRGMTWENIKHVFTTYDPELYIPLVFISYQLNWIFSGLNPFGYHLTNIILHAVNALIVTRILFQISHKKGLSIFAGIIFAIHPINTEAVVWLAGRKDLLAGTFFFAAFSCYLDSLNGGRKAYVASIIFFILALFSKVIAVTLLGIIVLHILLMKRKKFGKFEIVSLLPYGILSLIFMAIAIGGKVRIVAAVSMWDKILVACKSTIFYLQKFILPLDLTIIYPLQGDIYIFREDIFINVVLAIILVAVFIYSWRKYPWIAFGIGWYIATLSPTYLNIGKAGLVFFAVDRYAYLPFVGILYIFIRLLDIVFKKLHIFEYNKFRLHEILILIFGSIIFVSFIVISQMQTRVWDTPESIYQKTLSIYPESIGARVGLSSIYRHQNKLTEAFGVLQEGLKYGDDSLLHLYAGYIYAKTGQIIDAANQFLAAAEKDPKNPEPVFALGSLYDKTNEPERSIEYYKKAIDIDDSYVIARARLGTIYLNQNKIDEAYDQFINALEWNSNSYEANLGMALLLEKEGKTEEAEQYRKKVRLIETK